MPFLSITSGDIHYTDSGSGDLVFLLHGRTASAACWEWHIERLKERYRVIAFDSVNHGFSSNSPRDAVEPDRVQELEEVLAAFDVERPLLVGQSMGSMTSLRWAVKHPGRARAIVAAGMGWPVPGFEPGAPITRVKGGPPAAGLEDGLWLRSNNWPAAFAEEHPEMVERYSRLRSTATAIEAARHPRPFVMTDPSWTDEQLGERLKSIDTPLLLFVGAEDILAEGVRNIASLVPGSRVEVVAGADHNAYVQCLDQFLELAEKHLAEHA
jgi:pimeloyl-ACP methyl ester carboxylesterase